MIVLTGRQFGSLTCCINEADQVQEIPGENKSKRDISSPQTSTLEAEVLWENSLIVSSREWRPVFARPVKTLGRTDLCYSISTQLKSPFSTTTPSSVEIKECSALVLPGWLPMPVTDPRGRNQSFSQAYLSSNVRTAQYPMHHNPTLDINSMRLVTRKPVTQNESKAQMP